MVHPLLAGSALLRSQRTIFPRTLLCRYKSITAAIERGRQGGPDRPSSSRRRTSVTAARDAGDGRLKNRREARFERFGPPRDDPPAKRRDERVTSSRSSRFGRIGSPRSRGNAPSRSKDDGPRRSADDRPRRDDNEPPPQRRENGYQSRPGRNVDQGRRFEGRESRFQDRPREAERRELSQYREKGQDLRKERSADRDEQTAQSQRRSSFQDDANQRGGRKWDRPGKAPSQNWSEGRPERRPERTPERARRDEGPSYVPLRREEYEERQREPRFTHRPDSKGARRELESRSTRTDVTELKQPSIRGPESLPYTTAASEFIYGHSSVLAAMKANRRKLYNFYLHSRGANRDGLVARIRAQKLFSITHEVGDEYMRAMDKASSGRPHNGVILESSPLPVPPIIELKSASLEDESFSVSLDTQSAEDALVNGKQEVYPYKSGGWRHPLILYVDGVLDEGNLGAIARSAYFLGVDAIITPTRQTAPWSHIALKASAGAAEAIPLFKVGEPAEFLGKSSRAGWRIYASDAIPPASSISDSASDTPNDADGKIVYSIARSRKRLSAGHCPVAEHPTILMMGAEGTGLRNSLLNLAHYKVGIPHGREVDEIGVDSLNVSVAASLLCYEMLQRPRTQAPKNPEEILF